jgi:hypothetical protein
MKKLLFLLVFLVSYNLLAADITFTEVGSGSIKASLTGNASNIIIVVHKDDIKPVAPASAKYEAGSDFSQTKPSQLTGEGNLVAYKGSDKSAEFSVKGLAPATKYAFDVYEAGSKSSSKSFRKSTLAAEPTQQVKALAFSAIKEKSMNVLVSKGNGSRYIVLAREGKAPELPTDGAEYKFSPEMGKGDKIGTDTYVTFMSAPGSDDNISKLTNLEPGTKYFFTALEANGTGETTNYNLEVKKFNSTSRVTLPVAPKALETEEASNNSFTARWSEAKGAVSYELDVATDREFRNLVADYTAMDVGKISSILVEELPKADKYYYRLRTIGEGGLSENSDVIEVRAK